MIIDLLGFPYKKLGWRIEDGGLDCFGAVLVLFDRLGGEFAKVSSEARSCASEQELWSLFPANFEEIKFAEKAGDVVTTKGHMLAHIGNGDLVNTQQFKNLHIVRAADYRGKDSKHFRLRSAL